MSTSFFRTISLEVFLLLALLATPILSYGQILQVDLSIPMSTKPLSHEEFKTTIIGGSAILAGTALNLLTGETVLIDLALYYRIPRGTIAYDELINGIEVTTETQEGEILGTVILDTQLIPLNPNRASLFYRTTLYYPKDSKVYIVHIRVFGNYE
jgi:hypothetical protein